MPAVFTTDARYLKWIADYHQSRIEWAEDHICGLRSDEPYEKLLAQAVQNQCMLASKEMSIEFPELRLVRGHYYYSEHWWLEAPDGSIVDPTKEQFLPGYEYKEYAGPDPVGKCLVCGVYVWDTTYTSSACSAECLEELRYEYGSGER